MDTGSFQGSFKAFQDVSGWLMGFLEVAAKRVSRGF